MCKRNIVFFLQQFGAFRQRRTPPLKNGIHPLPSRCLRPAFRIPPDRSPASFVPRMADRIRLLAMLIGCCLIQPIACCAENAVSTEPAVFDMAESIDTGCLDPTSCRPEQDRVFLVSSRHLPHEICRAPLTAPPLRIRRLDGCNTQFLEIEEYESLLSSDRPVIIYIHGNRMPNDEVVSRGTKVYRHVRRRRNEQGIDWVIFSWPSSMESLGVSDFREKADRCNSQAFYVAWLMRRHLENSISMGMVGYSFGCRIATGALHVLAGGSIRGYQMQGHPVIGARINVGLVAPAIESHWLESCGFHGQATKNMDSLLLLYNRRDVVLKRYWLINNMRRETALGYSGPTRFAPRVDGSRLPVTSRDCAPTVKFRHSELDYYESSCKAGCDMARMVNGIFSFER